MEAQHNLQSAGSKAAACDSPAVMIRRASGDILWDLRLMLKIAFGIVLDQDVCDVSETLARGPASSLALQKLQGSVLADVTGLKAVAYAVSMNIQSSMFKGRLWVELGRGHVQGQDQGKRHLSKHRSARIGGPGGGDDATGDEARAGDLLPFEVFLQQEARQPQVEEHDRLLEERQHDTCPTEGWL